MELSGASQNLIKSLLNNFQTSPPCFMDDSPGAAGFQKLSKSLHTEITAAYRATISSLPTPKFLTFKHNSSAIPKSPLLDTLPAYLRDIVLTEAVGSQTYNWDIGSRSMRLSLVFYSQENMEDIGKAMDLVSLMATWLRMACKVSRANCSHRSLQTIIYLLPNKKVLPNSLVSTIGKIHVNSGVATSCQERGEICVYREEEVLKVFIHETFHALGLDTAGYDDLASLKELNQVFPIENADISLKEAYTEWWARIINSALICYKSKSHTTYDEFVVCLTFTVNMERTFALFQVKKILRHMGLTFASLYGTDASSRAARRVLYREDTPVFSYYILVALMLFDFSALSDTFVDQNVGLFKLQTRAAPYAALVDSVHRALSNPCLSDTMMRVTNYNDDPVTERTTRMSIIELA
jgi:hypothetical protein